jgi:hypothetical protein
VRELLAPGRPDPVTYVLVVSHGWNNDEAEALALSADRLTGPVVITHTRNDRSVGIAYALASRLARQVAAAIGDADSRYGGLGSNGARRTPEANGGNLLPATQRYRFAPGTVYNLLADQYIASHGEVTGPEVATRSWPLSPAPRNDTRPLTGRRIPVSLRAGGASGRSPAGCRSRPAGRTRTGRRGRSRCL